VRNCITDRSLCRNSPPKITPFFTRKKASGKKTKTEQKSKIEKAFAIEEKGMKNAFKLF
jgi:hypothetical protein